MRITFDKVTRRATRAGVCQSCGKRRTQSTTFYQTLNPFNKGTDGLPKTREQIAVELEQQAIKWMKGKAFCNACMCECPSLSRSRKR